jgi:hypothetical protein
MIYKKKKNKRVVGCHNIHKQKQDNPWNHNLIIIYQKMDVARQPTSLEI